MKRWHNTMFAESESQLKGKEDSKAQNLKNFQKKKDPYHACQAA